MMSGDLEEIKSKAEGVEQPAVENVKPNKGVKMLVRVVPWYNAAEFRKVHEYLYSHDLKKINWAIDTISVWESRCYPSLPTAIDCTYLLISTIFQDIMWTSGKTLSRFIDIHLLYCNAIIRFVNLTVGAHQDDGDHSTMTNKAKALGISSYIVDLRNEACHSARPSLELLRLAADEAMNYLKKSYWEPEAAKVKNHRKRPLDRKEIKQSLANYLNTQFEIISLQKKGKAVPQKLKNQLKQCLADIFRLIDQNKRHFIDVLVKDDIFIPRDDDMKFIVSKEIYETFTDIHDEVVDKKSCRVPKASCIPEVPELHETLWLPVVRQLNLCEIVPLFLEALLQSQGDRSVIGQKMVIAWVNHVLKVFDESEQKPLYRRTKTKLIKIREEEVKDEKEEKKYARIRKVFKKKGMVADWYTMFYSALRNPCKYTPLVLPFIICHLKGCDAAVQRFTTLLAIHLGHTITENTPIYNRIFTVDDLRKAEKVRERKEGGSLSDELEECFFEEYTGDEHKKWPIGYRITSARLQKEEEEEDEEEFEAYDENKEIKQRCFSDNEDPSDDDIEEVVKPMSHPNFDEELMRELESRKSFLYKYE